MKLLTTILILFVAFEHFYFLILEMFLWTKPKGIKTFGLKNKEFAEDTKVLAANQGLYNGILVAGIIYSLIINATNFLIFFLTSIVIAGIYGAYSTRKIRLFYVQSIPALLALVLLIINLYL
ncbi:DUF1304 domain-containing protein [Pontimicrobium sp. MEBiC01747]